LFSEKNANRPIRRCNGSPAALLRRAGNIAAAVGRQETVVTYEN